MLVNSPRLTTGTQHDPLLPKLLEAIYQASDIEIAVSFIQPSGLELLFEALLEALNNGALLRILTSDYLDITHPRALRELLMLAERGAEVRVFECRGQTSFHLKTYILRKIKMPKLIKVVLLLALTISAAQDCFADYFQELIDLRLAQYFARKNTPYPIETAAPLLAAETPKSSQLQQGTHELKSNDPLASD